ncbi:NAD(P)-dependent oxidoreductase [Candidatus Nitrosacidococcus tergens]|uniref:6-phosphogluconate dehydrogenase NAD-binding protein n=1 Tax=Candidatus Nitrosacidococcus tergens TaxID=553981 RepID=A0A7G1Q9Q0_9GAMM|nr:NAD(P)-dependent oxidoreductase [Candidatus Nitrosacidococcus tergens]CAB1275467.1 6-phosphogluconate dehydrogenase NAD-binding protein [Candidatus Nitrosacidococcus tergens]
MRAGFIGLGAMGIPMARNLAKNRFLSTVWNRTQSVADTLAKELRVASAQQLKDLAEKTEIIFICVSKDEDVLAVIDSLHPYFSKQHIIIDCSTTSSETARKVACIVRSKGGDFLDSPVSGGVEGACQGTLAFMVGGNANALNTVYPLLNAMGNSITHMGEVGTGQATKAVNQVMAAGINEAVTEALAFGQAQGLDMSKVIEVITQGAASNWFLKHRGNTMMKEIFNHGFKLKLHQKDLQICKEIGEQLGINLPLTETAFTHYQTLIDQGFGEEDISALFRLKSRLS